MKRKDKQSNPKAKVKKNRRIPFLNILARMPVPKMVKNGFNSVLVVARAVKTRCNSTSNKETYADYLRTSRMIMP
jgi:hypothetical protein